MGDMMERARAWLRDYDNAESVEHLTTLLESVRREALEAAAKVAEGISDDEALKRVDMACGAELVAVRIRALAARGGGE